MAEDASDARADGDGRKDAPKNGQAVKESKKPGDGSSIVEIIEVIAKRVDPIIKLTETILQHSLKSKVTQVRFNTWMAGAAVLIVFLILAGATWLTYVGKLDGSTYGFLLGVIVGYVLTFVRDAVIPPKEPNA